MYVVYTHNKKGKNMKNEEFYIGQKFYKPYPTSLSIWLDNNNAEVIEKHEEKETEAGIIDIRYYEICKKPKKTAPTNEEIIKMREMAYIAESDPITAHISYLQRKEQTPEIVAEIAQLEAEQEEIRNAIKERFPYHE